MENKRRVLVVPTSHHCRDGPIHFIKTKKINDFNGIILV